MRLFSILAVQFCLVVWSLGSAGAYNLPDTGQTKCYQIVTPYAEMPCAGTGQDGEYNINTMSYNDNDNSAVTDNNTGFMWQKCSVGQNNDSSCSGTAATYNWYQATGIADSTYNPSGDTNICGALSLGEHSDWRLPTQKELLTIVDYSIPFPGPNIEAEYFPKTNAYAYWTSTTDAIDSDRSWVVNYGGGTVYNYSGKASYYYVRCVRGGQTSQSFANNGNGTVTDNNTGLMWKKCSAGQTDDTNCSGSPAAKSWNDALGYCNTPYLGYADWRLPNIKELDSLTDTSRYNPSIITNTDLFPNTSASNYWSSTTYAGTTGDYAWSVNFSYGQVSGSSKNSSYYVRCVRGRQGEASYVRLMRGGTAVASFDNIQDAYNTAQGGDIIEAQAVESTENQTFVATKAVSLKGGYDSGFTSNSGFTVIDGNLTIIGGTVTVENLKIR